MLIVVYMLKRFGITFYWFGIGIISCYRIISYWFGIISY